MKSQGQSQWKRIIIRFRLRVVISSHSALTIHIPSLLTRWAAILTSTNQYPDINIPEDLLISLSLLPLLLILHSIPSFRQLSAHQRTDTWSVCFYHLSPALRDWKHYVRGFQVVQRIFEKREDYQKYIMNLGKERSYIVNNRLKQMVEEIVAHVSLIIHFRQGETQKEHTCHLEKGLFPSFLLFSTFWHQKWCYEFGFHIPTRLG